MAVGEYADSVAVLALRSRGGTRCAPFGRFAQTPATSRLTKRAVRADLKALLLTAPECAPAEHRLPLRMHLWWARTNPGSAKAGWGRLWRASVAVRSAGLMVSRAARFVN